MGYAQSKALKKWLLCYNTIKESVFIVYKGHKRCGLPKNIHHVSPHLHPFMWLLGRTVGQGSGTGRKAAVFGWGSLSPRACLSMCGRAISDLRKALNLSFARTKRKIDFNSMAFWKMQNYGNNKKISDCQEFVGEMNIESTEVISMSSENTLNSIMMRDIHHYSFVQIYRSYSTTNFIKVNSRMNWGPWWLQCISVVLNLLFLFFKKRYHSVDNGMRRGEGVYGEFL